GVGEGGGIGGGVGGGGGGGGGGSTGGGVGGGSGGGTGALDCATVSATAGTAGCEFWGTVMDNGVDQEFRGGISDGGQGTSSSAFGFLVTALPGANALVQVTRIENGV